MKSIGGSHNREICSMPRDVYFLLLPNVTLVDFAAMVEPFRIAQSARPLFRIHFVAPTNQIASSANVVLANLESLPENLPESAIVVIPGTPSSAKDYSSAEAEQAAIWLKDTVRTSHWICTVCSGIFLVEKAGLLHGRKCTTHFSLLERLRQSCPSAQVLENKVFVRDGNLFSCAGAMAGFDLALHLVSELFDDRTSLEVAKTLVFYARRFENDQAASPWLEHRMHAHPLVHAAQDRLEKKLSHPWTVEALAQEVHTSARHLSRLFKQHAGISPRAYIAKLRAAAASEYLRNTNLSLEQIAATVGFSSPEHMRRTYRSIGPLRPSQLRRRAA